jgi:hypothetical protein
MKPWASISFHGASKRLGPMRLNTSPFAAVLADERRGESEAATRLQVGGELEHRRGQQMHLVVDDEAPVQRPAARGARTALSASR